MEIPAFAAIESLSLGKAADASLNEDRLVIGPGWVGVVDGATDKSGLRFEGHTPGWFVAQITADALATAPGDLAPAELVGRLSVAVDAGLRRLGVAMDPRTRACASLVCASASQRVLVRVGDCAFRHSGHSDMPRKPIDQIASRMRAAVLAAELAEGADPEDLRDADPGRAAILALLERQGVFQNLPDHPLGFGAINGAPVPEALIEIHPLPPAGELVLASDGYPVLADSLEASEQALAQALVADPLRIGEHASTKAIPRGACSFDDRTYLRVRL